MKQSASRRLLAIVIASSSAYLTGALCASAQVSAQPDISGRWLLKSAPYASGCTMSGRISFTKPNKTGAAQCTLLVEVNCIKGVVRPAEYWRVKQSCTAKVIGDNVSITSKVDRVEDATRDGVPVEAEGRSTYTSDNFNLILAKNRTEMTGQSVATYSPLQMRFWREAELSS